MYGIADADSLTNDATGNLIFPMKAVKIVDEQGNDVREYSQSGIYILGARLEGAMITLERATLSDGTYVAFRTIRSSAMKKRPRVRRCRKRL